MNYNFDEVIQREGTLSYKYDLRGKVFGDSGVVPLWVADMDFRTPDFVIEALRRRLDHEILGYSIPGESFYEAIIQWNKRRHGWTLQHEWISFSPGLVPALNLLVMAFTEPGDSIIIQPPVYRPFFTSVLNHQRHLVSNPLRYENGAYSIDFEDLKSKITDRTKMLIFCNPHNPTGNVWSVDVLKQLGALCMQNNILMVSDEIHADLVYPGQRHIPLASVSEEISRHTITCMSASKTFNLAGLATAYLVMANKQLKETYDRVLDQVHVGEGNIFGFLAATAAYNGGDDWVRQLMEYLTGNLRFLQDYIGRHIPLIKVIPPQATYLVWLDCRQLGMSAEALRSFMIHEAGIGLNDGPQFGLEGEGFQRINIGCSRRVLQPALMKLHRAVDKKFNI